MLKKEERRCRAVVVCMSDPVGSDENTGAYFVAA